MSGHRFAIGTAKLLGVLLACNAAAQNTASKYRLEYSVIAPADIHAAPQGPRYAEATLGLRMTNHGDAPVKVALVAPGAVLQLAEGGFQFKLEDYRTDLSGLSYCYKTTVADCETFADNFTVLETGRKYTINLKLLARLEGRELGRVKWGRFSGILFVRELGGGKSWMEPFTIDDVELKASR